MADTVLEHDAAPPWTEPFAAMFWRLRVQTYIIGLAFVVVVFQGALLYSLGARASAHVYEVHPDGQTFYIGEREANLAPRASEVRHVAKQFVELLYGWNSSTVHQDLAAALSLCSPAMGEQLRNELAAAQFVDTIRRRGIRSEVVFKEVAVEHGRRQSRVRLGGRVNIFPIAEYEGSPIESREFGLVVVLAAVPRDPELRLNGIEIVRVVRDSPGASSEVK